MKRFPKITIAIPTFNESSHIKNCLNAIFGQKYPKNKLEVIVVDNYSTDDTLKIIEKFPVKLIMNKVMDAQFGKMLAFKVATGEYFIYLDADLTILGRDWFLKMLQPMLDDELIVGSFTRVQAKASNYSAITRYLSYDPFQRDPIFEYLSPTVDSTIVESKKGYKICEYNLGRIPPTGLCLFRKKLLSEVWKPGRDKKYMELDSLVRLIKAGHNRFAYVEGTRFNHPFLDNLTHLAQKRLKHIKRNYLKQETPREYLWVDLTTLNGKVKIIIWIIYANLIFPATIRGIYKSIKYNDIVCMYEPVVAFMETWIIIYGFMRYSLFQ